MKIAFTFSHMDNFALNETRKWEFIDALRKFYGYVQGQKLDSYDAIDAIGLGNLPYFVDEFGRTQLILSRDTVACTSADDIFDKEVVLHALRVSNSRLNLLTGLRALKANGGSADTRQVKTLAKHFKEMLDRTEW
jgi:hypothetical protein